MLDIGVQYISNCIHNFHRLIKSEKCKLLGIGI